MVYIRQNELPALKQYKYSGVDHSLISRYVLKPYWWSQVIELFPLSMAPNAITLSGFVFVVINFLTMLWYNPTLDQDMPRWVYASWSIGLFLYQTFDAIDGSQARRTRQSGPLGELFDHGVDACNTTLEVVLFSAAMNLGQGWQTVLILFATNFTFFVQTWDEYYTQTLTLGIVSGPVEGILTLCVVYAITAIKGGGSFWHSSMLEAFGIPKLKFIPGFVYEMPFTDWYMVYGGLVLVANTVQSSLNVLQHRNAQSAHLRSKYSPLLDFVPAFAMWGLVASYLYLQPVILHYHLVPFCFVAGIMNAYVVGKIIVAHLVKSPHFPWTNILMVPLALAVVDSLGLKLGVWPSVLGDGTYQIAFMFACLGLTIGVYGSFVHDVITTICDYLDIWCLTIKHPYTEETEAKTK